MPSQLDGQSAELGRLAPPDKPLLHRYPVIDGRGADIGSVAYCGFVKRTPPRFPDIAVNRPGYQCCVVCIDLDPWGPD